MFKGRPNFFTSKKKKLAIVETLTQEGKSFVESNDYAAAIVSYTKAIQTISTSYETYVHRAEAYRLLGNYQLSIQDCDKSISFEPNVAAYCTKAHVLLNLKQLDGALQCCELAVALSSPTDTQARKMQSMVKETKNKTEAEKYKSLGDEILNSKHDFQKAVEAYTKAISFDCTKYVYYNNRALAYLLYGDYEFAIYDCEKSINILPNGKAYGRKAAALCDLGRIDEALQCIDKALTFLPENNELLNAKHTILEKVNAENSVKDHTEKVDFFAMASTCTLALKLSKKEYAHYNNRAIAHLGAGEFQRAIEDCEESLKIKRNMKAFRNLALIYCEQNNIVEAFAYINTALKMEPHDGQSLDIKKKLERLQRESTGLGFETEEEKIRIRECQAAEDKLLLVTQNHARSTRLTLKRLRLEKIAKRVRRNYAKLFGRKMVGKGLNRFITAYSDTIAAYKAEDENLLRNLRRARSSRFIARQENDLLRSQIYSRACRQKPPPNTIMSSFFKFNLESSLSNEEGGEGKDRAREVEILDQRMNITPLDTDDTSRAPSYEKVVKLCQKMFRVLKRDWPQLPFAMTYTDAEEVVISFDTDTLRVDTQLDTFSTNREDNKRVNELDRYGSACQPLHDQDLARYMTTLAVSGLAANAKLRPQPDRWRVLETAIVPPPPPPPLTSRSSRTTPCSTPSGTTHFRKDHQKPKRIHGHLNMNSILPLDATEQKPSQSNTPIITPTSTPLTTGRGKLANQIFNKNLNLIGDTPPGTPPSSQSNTTTPNGTPVTSKRKQHNKLVKSNSFHTASDDASVLSSAVLSTKSRNEDTWSESGRTETDLDREIEAVLETKEILVFAFYVPIYPKKNTLQVHGNGSVQEEIRLIKAYDAFNNKKQLKPLVLQDVAATSPSKRGGAVIKEGGKLKMKGGVKKSPRPVMLPPVDAYGTNQATRGWRMRESEYNESFLPHSLALASTLNIPPAVLSSSLKDSPHHRHRNRHHHGYDNKNSPTSSAPSTPSSGIRQNYFKVEEGFEVYNPKTIPKDYKLYNTVRNTNSW